MYADWDYWQLFSPITFDGENRLIIVNDGESAVSVRGNIYSDWKEWSQLRDNTKFEPAFRITGGDPVGGGEYTGDVYFLINNWRIRIDHNCVIDGVIYSDDYPSPFVPVMGTQIVTNKVSALVNTIEVSTGSGGTANISAAEIASAVWNAMLTSYNIPGTFGSTNQLPFVTGPTAAQIRQEMDLNSTQLTNIAANTATIINDVNNLPGATDVALQVWGANANGYIVSGSMGELQNTIPGILANTTNIQNSINDIQIPTAIDIRNEIDANSTQLASIAANTVTIVNNTEEIQSNLFVLESSITSVPSAADIRAEMDANSTQLTSIAANTSTLLSEVDTVEESIIDIQNNIDAIPIDVWNVKSAGNTNVGTFGSTLAAAGSGGVDPVVIAEAVWNANAATYSAVGTMGNLVNQTASLTPEQTTMIMEMYRLMGLDPTKPLVVTQTSRTAGANITQTIDSSSTTTTVTRI